MKNRTLGKLSPSWEGPWKILRVFSNNVYEVEELVPDNRVMHINVDHYCRKLKEHKTDG